MNSKLILIWIYMGCGVACISPDRKPLDQTALRKEDTVTNKWFQGSQHHSLKLEFFQEARLKEPTWVYETKDIEIISKIQGLIHSLPSEGEEMIGFTGAVPLLKVHFLYHSGADTIQFLNHRIKTPATSFFSVEPQQAQDVYQTLLDVQRKAPSTR